MNNLTYPYNLSEDYYADVHAFGDAFIEFSEKFNFNSLEEAFEGLTIGVYWNLFKEIAIDLSTNVCKMLSTLSNHRNDSDKSKDLIDDVRGRLLTKYLNVNLPKEKIEFNEPNFKALLDYLEATGDYVYQLPHFKKWINHLTQDIIKKFLDLSDWFFKNSLKFLNIYTLELEDYFKINNVSHKMKEDIIFFNSPPELYYLNMLGADLMNRIFKEDFQKRKRKALLLPTCMRISHKNCKASKTRLGPTCTLCNKNCNIYKIAKEFPHEIYLIEHSSNSLKDATKKDLEELGIIGVTCVLNLISGGWQASNLGIPPQCVLLNRVACSKHWLDEDIPSTIDLQELNSKI